MAMLQSLTNLQRKMNYGHGTVNPEGSKSSTRRMKRNSSGSFDSEKSSGGSSSSSHKRKRKRKRRHRDHSQDEFKKDKPPTFDGEINTSQEDEALLLEMKKYFQVQDYSRNMKARVAVAGISPLLQGKNGYLPSIGWKDKFLVVDAENKSRNEMK